MTHDFQFFEPARVPGGRVLAYAGLDPLFERMDVAETTTSEALDRLTEHLSRHDPSGVQIPAAPEVQGDRTLPVPVTYSSAAAARHGFVELALTHRLGLADLTDERILVHGDEDPAFIAETAECVIPAVSRAGMVPLLEHVKTRLADYGAFLVVERADTDQVYAQTTHERDRWIVEYCDGSSGHACHVEVATTQEAAQMIIDWCDGNTGTHDHG